MPSGPDASVKITEAYAKHVARDVYFWAWPMVGTKNKDLHLAADGSLTICVQAEEPTDKKQRANWLPTPKDGEFSLYVRAYWPQTPVTDGSWTPPPVEKR